MRRTHVPWAVALALMFGCAATNEDLLERAAGAAGLPCEAEGFLLVASSLKGVPTTFHYLRATPPGELWVLRFERSPAEQEPAALVDLDALLKEIAGGKKGFEIVEKTRFLSERAAPVKAAYFVFEEDGAHREGCLCLWEDSGGSYVFALRCVADEKPSAALMEHLLAACGAE